MFHFTELEKFCVFFKKLDLIAILHLKPNALLSVTVTITARNNPPEVFLGKDVLKIMQQIYKRSPMLRYYGWDVMGSAWVFSCKFAAYF